MICLALLRATICCHLGLSDDIWAHLHSRAYHNKSKMVRSHEIATRSANLSLNIIPESSRPMCNHLESPGVTWIYLVTSGAIWGQLEPCGAIWAHLGHLEPSGTTWSHLEPSGAIWRHLELSDRPKVAHLREIATRSAFQSSAEQAQSGAPT